MGARAVDAPEFLVTASFEAVSPGPLTIKP